MGMMDIEHLKTHAGQHEAPHLSIPPTTMDVVPPTPTPNEAPRDDPDFSASDADLCILSSDNVRFKVHSTNLRSASSIFPAPPPTAQADDPAQLDEPAAVLRVFLAFIYPDPPHPELEALDFQLLYSVAIAADKYQFMVLVYLCELVLEKHLAAHPFHNLRYASLRRNKRILDRVALETLKFGLNVAVKELRGEAELFRRWIMYREAIYASFVTIAGRYSSQVDHSKLTESLRTAVTQRQFDPNILFSTTEDIDGWLQTWGSRVSG